MDSTAYEEGIDDQSKIARLLEEVAELKSEISFKKGKRKVRR
ncbi:hypothetical protein [Bacillus sp. SA1-12]|nr:hypothetical protein [Bacillus sp. SA1-12]